MPNVYIFLSIFLNLLTFPLLSNNTLPAQYRAYYYNLEVEPLIISKEISATVEVHFFIQYSGNSITLDLAEQFVIDSILFRNSSLEYTRSQDAVQIKFPITLQQSEHFKIRISYHGKPKESVNPPWDGGFVWQKDSLNRPWIGVACEGIGAKSWWPCQDNWSMEPDSMQVTVISPQDLMGISNGVLQSKASRNNKTYTTWKIHYPINLYNISVNIGHYVHYADTLLRQDDSKLPLDYYILDYNKDKALKHFTQVPILLENFEHYFGNYPFPQDGYALIETSYWGMEHQSAIAYGNKFKNNFYDYDYIIVHESAHEWWGNSITANDPGNMWIHETFATYSESLLAERLYGEQTAFEYLSKQRLKITNTYPIAGPLGINFQNHQGTDQYYKGSWMLQTIRKIIDNDSLWFTCLKNFQSTYKHQTISREEVINFFNKSLHQDLNPVFSQYLDYTNLPTITYQFTKKKGKKLLQIKWLAEASNFSMPIEFSMGGKKYKTIANNHLYISIEIPNLKQEVKFNIKDYLINLKKP
jgi:aminopeptidase N